MMYSPKTHPSKSGPSEETKATIDMIKSDLDSGIRDEQDAIKYYENMVALYGGYGWRWIFEVILNEEREHLAKLLEAKRAIEAQGRITKVGKELRLAEREAIERKS
jgi:rubrerythrin